MTQQRRERLINADIALTDAALSEAESDAPNYEIVWHTETADDLGRPWTTAAAVFGVHLVGSTVDDRDHAFTFCEKLPPEGDGDHPVELGDWWLQEPLRRMLGTFAGYRRRCCDHDPKSNL